MFKEIKYYETLEEFIDEKRDKSINYLILVAQDSSLEFRLLHGYNYYGAIFPQVIFKTKKLKKGFLICSLHKDIKIDFIKSIKDTKELKYPKSKSLMVILDGLSTYNSSFLAEVFSHVGDIFIMGGGAGKDTLKQEKILFNNEGVFCDAAILLYLDFDLDIGSFHGYEKLKGPFLITKSKDNSVKKIDYKDAFSVYKSVVEEDLKESLSLERLKEISYNYPLGILRYKGEVIVRDILDIKDNSLNLIEKVDDNSLIAILKGEKESIVEAAKISLKSVLKGDSKRDQFIIFDCFTRENFLEESRSNELEEIEKLAKGSTIFGVVTIGEIANCCDSYITFLNKTCVVGARCS